jgi:antibiotic biosynthesis monooxygenase (ABM) superfamily enzyme
MGMVEVVITYKLKPGVSREEYRAWSRDVDQPIASRQPGVLSYKIIEIEGGDAEAPFDILEVIQATSWEAWKEVPEREEMQPVVARFLELFDPGTVHMLHGREIQP